MTWGTVTSSVPGVSVDRAAMRSLADELGPLWSDLDRGGRYHPAEMFCEADALVFHSMLRKFQPERVIEVGSGFSTAVALDTAEAHDLSTEISCIEPYPERLRSLLRPGDPIQLHEALVQDVPLEIYRSLGSDDILFIDSTHVVKAGSDVVWTTLHVLPTLRPGVLVHIHDVFWPFEYRPEWLRSGRDWTEIYLLHAFLSGNPEWEVLFFNDLVWSEFADVVDAYAPITKGQRPGGLWLRKTA